MTKSINLSKVNKKTTDVNDTSIPIESVKRKECGLDWAQSSWLRWIHVAFWTWLNPILNIGYKRPLTDDDLFDLSPNDECHNLLNKFEKNFEKNEIKYEYINIWKIILKTFWKECLIAGLILFPFMGIKLIQPLLLKQIILNINNSNIAYLYAIGLGFSTIIRAIIHHQFFFRTIRVGTQLRVALSSIIYKKLLSLPTRSIMKIETGQLINLISNDVSKFEDLFVYIHYIWEAPIEAFIIFILIWNEIGIPTLFGYGILLLQIPLQLFFSKKFANYRKKTIEWTDKRVKIVNEILVGCQIVKMYRWEEALENLIYNARKNEFKSIRKASRIRAINMAIYFSSLSLISLSTFVGSWLMNQTLSPASIFTVLSLFSAIQYPLVNALPYGIERLSESMISSKRINHFMNLSKDINNKRNENIELGCIKMDKALFRWNNKSCELININLNIKQGSLIGIIGSIGSCKSSLLSAILGEMYLVEGISKINGKISYVSQIPWIFAGTIRENILFNNYFNEEKYKLILKSCELINDLELLSYGDLTIIGEKGVNLSGGQKARISLARSLYNEGDIYLFDDPLASVDITVGRKIFQECISNQGIIKNKTRLFVTNQLEYLKEFDHCILLNNGQIEKQGLFNINESYENYQFNKNDINKKNNIKKSLIDENSIIKEETSINGNININIWLKLFTYAYGLIGLVILIILLLLAEIVYDGTNKWLSIWSSKSKIEQNNIFYVYIYIGLSLSTLIISLIRADYFFHLILIGASKFHNKMFKGVLYSSLRFYESNPIGRILNRFSKDQQVIDELLPTTFFDTIQHLIIVLGSFVIIGMSNPWVLFIFIIIIPIFLWLRKYYLRTSRNIKRLESITRSPIYALYSSTLNGLITIRAFNKENEFLNLFINKINANSRAFFIFACSGRWFGLRLDLIVGCITFVTAILSVSLQKYLDSSSIALSLSYCISLTTYFQWGIRQSAETENYMTSVERIDEYCNLEHEENFYKDEIQPEINWPLEGKIQFENYKFKYRKELEPVLKDINLEILPKNKIGIIGRTGSGKSSIFQGLFRLTDKSSINGKILIDGIDIHKISLNDLRSILNIIPQSPILFSNTLRYNLDPFNYYTDQQLWDALEAVQLKNKIYNFKDKLNIEIAEYGNNFSVGECQLICIARAILKQSKILLIDEATAHVDTKTDQLIQQILREKFSNQTILTIAHRINTIIDSDQIVLIDNGTIQQYGTPTEVLDNHNNLLNHHSKI